MRLFSIILNVLHLLKSQGRHTQGPETHQHDANEFQAELQLIQTTLKQIHANSDADHALKNEELRLERKRVRIEQWTLGFFILGALVFVMTGCAKPRRRDQNDV